jgi:hypothetical protein
MRSANAVRDEEAEITASKHEECLAFVLQCGRIPTASARSFSSDSLGKSRRLHHRVRSPTRELSLDEFRGCSFRESVRVHVPI